MARWLIMAGLLMLLGMAAAHAEPPDPCDHYLPTGQALPREDTVRGMTPVTNEPNRQGQRVGRVHSGDHVEVLKECGRQVMVHLPDGTTGWIATTFLPNEEALARQARSRPVVTDQDCELRYDAGPLVENCKTALARKKSREEELAHSVYLKDDQLRAFVSGKTLTIIGRPGPSNDASHEPVTTAYFAPDGETFMGVGSGQLQFWRGRWFLRSDKLCLDVRADCSDVRRIPSGEIITTAPRGEYIATAEDGDAKGLVAQVSAQYPYPRPLPVPTGLEAVAHPVMGW